MGHTVLYAQIIRPYKIYRPGIRLILLYLPQRPRRRPLLSCSIEIFFSKKFRLFWRTVRLLLYIGSTYFGFQLDLCMHIRTTNDKSYLSLVTKRSSQRLPAVFVFLTKLKFQSRTYKYLQGLIICLHFHIILICYFSIMKKHT